MVSNKDMFLFLSPYYHCGLLGFYSFNVLQSITVIFLLVAKLTCILLLSNFYQIPLVLVPDFFPLPCCAAELPLGLWPPTELLAPRIFAQAVRSVRKPLQPLSGAQIQLRYPCSMPWLLTFQG